MVARRQRRQPAAPAVHVHSAAAPAAMPAAVQPTLVNLTSLRWKGRGRWGHQNGGAGLPAAAASSPLLTRSRHASSSAAPAKRRRALELQLLPLQVLRPQLKFLGTNRGGGGGKPQDRRVHAADAARCRQGCRRAPVLSHRRSAVPLLCPIRAAPRHLHPRLVRRLAEAYRGPVDKELDALGGLWVGRRLVGCGRVRRGG